MENEQIIEFRARIYVFDLKNCAREFGFKADEHWVVGMVSSVEKAVIEKEYFPTISVSVQPNMLAEICSSVKFRLNPASGTETVLDNAEISRKHLQHLVAYSNKRLRR